MSRTRKRFDWQKIHAALERRLSHLGASIDDDAGRVHELLRQRSIALATVPRDGHVRNRLARVLVFRLGPERYALPLDCAREVTGLTRSATVPGASAGILGIVNWRGEFVVVFDLAPLLGLPVASESPATRRVIVLRGEEPRIALAVDAVEEIIQVDPADLQSPEQLRSKHADLFKGAAAGAVLVFEESNLRARLGEELQAA